MCVFVYVCVCICIYVYIYIYIYVSTHISYVPRRVCGYIFEAMLDENLLGVLTWLRHSYQKPTAQDSLYATCV